MTEQIRPRTIALEASTFCQLKCPSCETAKGITHEKIGAGFLKFKDFKKLVDESPWISRIELANWGEIFLNPDILDILKYAYSKSVALTATNGSNLNTVKKEVLEALVKYKLRHITCALDGASQETYSIYRRGGNFERVIENIKTINHYKRLYKSNYPLLTWQFIAFGHNEHEIEIAEKLAKSLNMKFFIKLSWDENISSIKNTERISQATKIGVASRSEYIEKHGIDYLQKGICSQLWYSPQINWDGKVLGCCYNYWSHFGNAFESKFIDGLNNEKINYARQMLLGKVEAKEEIPCTTCGHYERMKKSGNWLTMSDLNSLRLNFEKLPYSLGRFGVWLTNRLPFLSLITQ
ncbi:MAG: radical SAM protein [Rhizonema sp. PD37]|nr:radical SAM protein [Rhizonema sp. PD37]